MPDNPQYRASALPEARAEEEGQFAPSLRLSHRPYTRRILSEGERSPASVRTERWARPTQGLDTARQEQISGLFVDEGHVRQPNPSINPSTAPPGALVFPETVGVSSISIGTASGQSHGILGRQESVSVLLPEPTSTDIPDEEDLISDTDSVSVREYLDAVLGDTLSSIQRRVFLSFRRHGFRVFDDREADFKVDWDLSRYLRENFDDGINQPLQWIFATVGTLSNAQYCTVTDYFAQIKAWAPYQRPLLQALQDALRRGGVAVAEQNRVVSTVHQYPAIDGTDDEARIDSITVDLNSNIVSVKGSEKFVVAIAQQLAWLCALSRDGADLKATQYAHPLVTDPTVVGDIAQEPSVDVTAEHRHCFYVTTIVDDIDYPLESVNASCWTQILGSSLLITGFPTRERRNSEKGLEANPQVIAGLAGISLGATYAGGYIYKARFHAMVPISLSQDCIQWHICSSASRNRLDPVPPGVDLASTETVTQDELPELEWEDIIKQCPRRLLTDTNEDVLWQSRGFFGWCASVESDIATNKFDFGRLEEGSGASEAKTMEMVLSKIQLGVSQIITGALEMSIGRRRRAAAPYQRADDYESLLACAGRLPVILYGSDDRAIQIDGKEMILHTLLHRMRLWQAQKDRKSASPDCLDAADPTRQETVHSAMVKNADKKLRDATRIDQIGTRDVLFKQEARRVYETLKLLRSELYRGTSNTDEAGLSKCSLSTHSIPRTGLQAPELFGWEYLDFVEDTLTRLTGRKKRLHRTCGDWHKYAESIQAVSFFTADLGNVLRPASPEKLCAEFKQFPPGKSYLAIRTPALRDQFRRQGTLLEQTRLTTCKLTLFGRADVFAGCPTNVSESSRGRRGTEGSCGCSRTQIVMSHRRVESLRKCKIVSASGVRVDVGPKVLKDDGCVLIGANSLALQPKTLRKTKRAMPPRAVFNGGVTTSQGGSGITSMTSETDSAIPLLDLVSSDDEAFVSATEEFQEDLPSEVGNNAMDRRREAQVAAQKGISSVDVNTTPGKQSQGIRA